MKNTIAILQSITVQTLRPVPNVEDVRATLLARFAALAKAHDLLLNQDFKSADLREVVELALAVHNPGGDRVDIAGPHLLISPQSALSMSLVIHELATNATKYGALSNALGRVLVNWSLSNEEDPLVAVGWREEGGPEVMAPKRTGFGSKLIQATLDGWGNHHFDYRPQGLEVAFSARMSALGQS